MISTERKMELIEQGIQEFAINIKFRDLIEWLIDEFDKTYEKMIKQRIDDAFKEYWYNIDKSLKPMPPKSSKRYKLVPIDEEGK